MRARALVPRMLGKKAEATSTGTAGVYLNPAPPQGSGVASELRRFRGI